MLLREPSALHEEAVRRLGPALVQVEPAGVVQQLRPDVVGAADRRALQQPERGPVVPEFRQDSRPPGVLLEDPEYRNGRPYRLVILRDSATNRTPAGYRSRGYRPASSTR